MRFCEKITLAVFMLMAIINAHAARPMITDDARTVDAKACQVESWSRKNRDGHEVWALPACNFTGNLELTIGGGLGKVYGEPQTSDVVLQGKTLIKPLETNSYGVGLVVGTVRHPAIHTHRNLLGDVYAYVPVSISMLNDRFVLHINAGMLRGQEERRNRGTWGLGSETQLNPATYLIAETFGQSNGKNYAQLGLRYWVVPDRVQLDTTVGERLHSGPSERWFSIGLRFLTPAFLP